MGQETQDKTLQYTITFTEPAWVPIFYKNRILRHTFVFGTAAVSADAFAVLSCFIFPSWAYLLLFQILLFIISFIFIVFAVPHRRLQSVEIYLYDAYLDVYREGMYQGDRGCFDVHELFLYDDILFCIFDMGKKRLEIHGAYTMSWFRNGQPYLEECHDNCTILSLRHTDAGEVCGRLEEYSPLKVEIF